MGLLSIFNRKKTAADTSRASGRGTGKARAAARSAPAAAMAAPADAAEAVREARARARRRLMGATVLLLIGVIGFPLLFESQPRPIPVDLPIEIPPRNGAAPVETGALPAARSAHGGSGATAVATSSAPAAESVSYDQRPSAAAPAVPHTVVAAAPAPVEAPAPASSRPGPAASARPAAAAPSKPAAVPPRPAVPARTAVESPAVPAPSASSTAAAAALMEVPNPAADRYIVQVAAFKPTDDAKIRDVRGRVEKLGLKTYTQPVETPAGKWIRVRVGPYPTKAEADSAVARIAAAGLGLQPKVYMP
jgi:DedD protein